MNSLLAKNVHWIAFAFALLVLIFHSMYIQPWTIDDAFISFRYAENFANGNGIVYNAGEYVEGYTTFLWVFLLGVGHFLGFDIVLLSKVLGFSLAVGTFLLLAHTHRFIPEAPKRVSAVAVVLVGACGMLSVWAMAGMEVCLVAFTVLLTVFLHFRSKAAPEKKGRAYAAGVACALAGMSRPECGLIFAILFIDRLVEGVTKKNFAFFHFGLGFSLVYGPFFLWRLMYYGYPFPNTFYAKVGGTAAQVERGYRYLGNFFRTALLILAPAIAAIFAGKGGYRKFGPVGVLAPIAIVQTVYVLMVGGDGLPAYRFLAPFMPIICLLAALGLAAWVQCPWRTLLVSVVIAAHSLVHLYYDNQLNKRVVTGTVWSSGTVVGEWLRENVPPDTLFATNTAGSIPYYSKLPTIDMLGLNDEHIAHRDVKSMGQGQAGHEKGDGKYVLSRKPDYIQFGSASGSQRPHFRSDREIYASPEFRKNYEFEVHGLPGSKRVQLYRRKDTPRVGKPAQLRRNAPRNQ